MTGGTRERRISRIISELEFKEEKEEGAAHSFVILVWLGME
jgi:hypothetical protein